MFCVRRYEVSLEFRVVGPRDGGKRYTALMNMGGREEWGLIFAPMKVLAPDGSINLEGKVM